MWRALYQERGAGANRAANRAALMFFGRPSTVDAPSFEEALHNCTCNT
jgi:hypothetical protein